MKEIKTYINENGIEISIEKERSEYLPGYLFETYFENGTEIYQNTYKHGQLSNVSFYAYSTEEVQKILIEKEGNVSISFIYYQKLYKITEQLAYQEYKLIGNMITVDDKDKNCICFKKYEMKDSELVCTTLDKNYYEKGEKKYEFIYNQDGSCFMIYNFYLNQKDIFAWDIGTSHTDFTWDGFEYYKNKEPLIPEK